MSHHEKTKLAALIFTVALWCLTAVDPGLGFILVLGFAYLTITSE